MYPNNSASSDKIHVVQNVIFIWLDNNIDDKNPDCRNTITQLRRAIHTIITFSDPNRCIQFINTIKDNKVCLVTSGSLGQQVVPSMHNMSEIDSIYIFCGDKGRHEQWTKEWRKIKGVFTNITSICEALKQAAQLCEQNDIPTSFVKTTEDATNNSLSQLDPIFIYSQILKEILLSIQFERQHFNQYIDFCRNKFDRNEVDLINLDKLKREYDPEKAIWWYTYESFFYRMLNHALRVTDVDIMIKMGFFTGDLHRRIVDKYNEQCRGNQIKKPFITYRGQGLSKGAFEQMKNTKGGLISFNSFLSTSTDAKISREFADQSMHNPDLLGILFVMTIDPSKSTTPFASIKDISDLEKENEVLFAMHTVFRIHNIKPLSGNERLFQVDLTLTSENNDREFRQITDHIRKETYPEEEGWYRLGLTLWKMGQSEKSEKVYQVLLEQAVTESDKAAVYNQLGLAKDTQGRYKEAIEYFDKAIKIYKKNRPSSDSDLVCCYSNIGTAYSNIGEYSKALSHYGKALKIRQQSFPTDDPDLANSYNEIGNVYSNMGEYSQALTYFEKTHQIQQKSLPLNHPDWAHTYNNIGNVYDNMGEYSKALSFHDKALKIREKSLPPKHPDLAISYNNIGNVYRKMGEYPNALLSLEKALKIQQESLPKDHPDLAMSYCNRGEVYRNMGEYSKALAYGQKALEIYDKSRVCMPTDVAECCNNIGKLHENKKDYREALPFFERAVNIIQQSLSPNHPDLKKYQTNLERIKMKL